MITNLRMDLHFKLYSLPIYRSVAGGDDKKVEAVTNVIRQSQWMGQGEVHIVSTWDVFIQIGEVVVKLLNPPSAL